jgi:hypothetical protein
MDSGSIGKVRGGYLAAALTLCVTGGFGCAHSHAKPQAPVSSMAQTVVEIHRAKQAGADYAPESAVLCKKAEASLEESRRLVWRERHAEAEAAARAGYAYAQQAREMARLPERVGRPAPSDLATVDPTLTGGGGFSASLHAALPE